MPKILIVDDELPLVAVLREQLTSHKYTVLSANDGKQGLAMIRGQNPDLVLLDLRMPVMDGMAMLRELRKDEKGKKVKVIILTNLEPTTESVQAVVKTEPTFYVIKSSITFASLHEKIKDVLSGKTI